MSAYATAALVLGLIVWSVSVALLCVYGVFMATHLVVLGFGRKWLYSRMSSVSAAAKGRHSVGYVTDEPGVSIIKPLIGCDPNLKVNLESFFQLDYSAYEILFCITESDNAPSLPVVSELITKYPSVSVRIFQGGESVGVNPKINNMLPAYTQTKYNLLWICDSNIFAPPYLLSELISHIGDPQVALVHQVPFTTEVNDFAGYLDMVYFGTQHSRVYLLGNLAGENCANGMSWLVKKQALEQEGGLMAFSSYLAEDFFMGKALWKRGWKFTLSTLPVLQNPGVRSLSSYQSRIIRWGRLRATMMPWPGLLEPFTECLGMGVIGALSTHYLFNTSAVLFLTVHSIAWFLFDLMLIKTLQSGPLGSLWRIFLAWCLRELWTFPLFLAGVWSREISWKGQRYRLSFGGKATKLE